MDAKVAEIEAIFSTDENSEVKLKEVVNVLSALLKSPDRHGSLDVSASNGGFKAKIKEAGETKFVFQISKNEEEEYEEEENEEEQYEKEENEEETDSERGVIFRRYTNDYHQRGQLGRGAYGRVYRCTHKLDEGDYVIKMVPFIPKDRQKTLREVRALRISQHPNVVRYHQCWIERGVHYVSSSGSSDAPEKSVDNYGSTLFNAMEYCQTYIFYIFPIAKKKKRLIHMDIKPENLFIDSSGTLKIGDFGLAVFSDEKDGDLDSSSYVGNPTYQAPELRDDNPTLTEKVDIFSAGLVLLEMVCSPIGTISEKSRLFERARRGEFPGEAGPVSNMMGASLSSDPSARPSASRILSKYYDA